MSPADLRKSGLGERSGPLIAQLHVEAADGCAVDEPYKQSPDDFALFVISLHHGSPENHPDKDIHGDLPHLDELKKAAQYIRTLWPDPETLTVVLTNGPPAAKYTPRQFASQSFLDYLSEAYSHDFTYSQTDELVTDREVRQTVNSALILGKKLRLKARDRFFFPVGVNGGKFPASYGRFVVSHGDREFGVFVLYAPVWDVSTAPANDPAKYIHKAAIIRHVLNHSETDELAGRPTLMIGDFNIHEHDGTVYNLPDLQDELRHRTEWLSSESACAVPQGINAFPGENHGVLHMVRPRGGRGNVDLKPALYLFQRGQDTPNTWHTVPGLAHRGYATIFRLQPRAHSVKPPLVPFDRSWVGASPDFGHRCGEQDGLSWKARYGKDDDCHMLFGPYFSPSANDSFQVGIQGEALGDAAMMVETVSGVDGALARKTLSQSRFDPNGKFCIPLTSSFLAGEKNEVRIKRLGGHSIRVDCIRINDRGKDPCRPCEQKQEACEAYATAAVNDEKFSEANQCFKDWRVNSRQTHYEWCMNNSPEKIEAQGKYRRDMIATCSFCGMYADRAVADEAKNEASGCFSDWKVHSRTEHVDWCVGASQAQAQAQARNRATMLDNCEYCGQYADRAVADELLNQSKGCNPGWKVNPRPEHVKWCVGVPRSTAENQARVRSDTLAACK